MVLFFYWGLSYQGDLSEPALSDKVPQTAFLTLDKQRYTLEVVSSEAAQIRGLSGRAKLGADEGMLFVNETDGFHYIWMKDMLFPIDILWLTREHKIIHHESNVSPDTFPQAFTSPVPARYVIELPAGSYQAGQETLFEF